MKVCVVSPGVVHATPRTVALADQFEKIHFIDVTGKADKSLLESHGIRYYGQEHVNKNNISRRRLHEILNTVSPDVIICHFASGDHFFNCISYAKCPVATIAMGQDVLYDAGDRVIPVLRKLLTRMALRRSFYISAKSEYLAARIRDYGVESDVEVNYWGADFNLYKPGSKTRARQELGLDENKLILLSPRAIEPRLNIHLIVEAFPGILSKRPDASLVLLGRSYPDYKNKVERLIHKLGIEDHVSILGEVSQNMLARYYCASDVVVSIARSEGFPNSLLEVMACKVPIVVGRIRQIEELFKDEINARICDIESDAIADAILDIVNNPEKRQRLSCNAFQTASLHADIRKNAILFSKRIKEKYTGSGAGSFFDRLIFRSVYMIFRIQRRLIRN